MKKKIKTIKITPEEREQHKKATLRKLKKIKNLTILDDAFEQMPTLTKDKK